MTTDYEKTIKYIENHGHISDSIKDTSINSIKKQIPKKPVVKAWHDYCPICYRELFGSKPNYCESCGQRLDWEEDNAGSDGKSLEEIGEKL